MAEVDSDSPRRHSTEAGTQVGPGRPDRFFLRLEATTVSMEQNHVKTHLRDTSAHLPGDGWYPQ